MKQINKGDYVLTKNSELWLVKNIRKEGQDFVYDLEPIEQPSEVFELNDWKTKEYKKAEITKEMIGVSHSYIIGLGRILPKDSKEVMKILFGFEDI